MARTEIIIKDSDRVFFTGKTGSGKTYAARFITRSFPRLIVLDPKGTLGGPEWALDPWDRESRRALRNGRPVRARVTVPFGADVEDIWDDVFNRVYQAGDCTVYIDEVYGVVLPGSRPSPGLTGIWTRGRELNIGAFAASQRPVWVPLFILSEAEHFFMFRLSLSDDKRRMSEFMGPTVEQVIRDKHGVYYSHAEDDDPAYFERLPLSLPRRVGAESAKIQQPVGAGGHGD
jgi:hypothetical protein